MRSSIKVELFYQCKFEILTVTITACWWHIDYLSKSCSFITDITIYTNQIYKLKLFKLKLGIDHFGKKLNMIAIILLF